MVSIEKLEVLLPEGPDNFPLGEGIKVLRGKTLVNNKLWKKAIILIENRAEKKQIRLYGWFKGKDGNLSVRQKFNISPGYSDIIIDVLISFLNEHEKGDI